MEELQGKSKCRLEMAAGSFVVGVFKSEVTK
jgi:hypothetical protein